MRDPEDTAAFRGVIAEVYAFYRVDLSNAVMSVWWNSMRGYDLPQLREAFGRHVVDPERGQFLPKPADVVRLLEGGAADVSVLAWYRVEQTLRDVGTYESVTFDDPLTQRVIYDMGGWVWLGQQTVKEWPFVQQRFCAAYRAYRARGVPSFPPHLPGVTEAENTRTGYPVPPPKLIGNMQRALEVLRTGSHVGMVAVHTLPQLAQDKQ